MKKSKESNIDLSRSRRLTMSAKKTHIMGRKFKNGRDIKIKPFNLVTTRLY